MTTITPSTPQQFYDLLGNQSEDPTEEIIQFLQNLPAERVDRFLCYRDAEKKTTLHLACWIGYHRVVEMLLAAGADRNAADIEGFTPLHVASQIGHHQIVESLLVAGAEMNIASRDKKTPLFVAAERGMNLVVERLLSTGADMNVA